MTEQKLVPVPYELLVRARHIVGDRAAGGRMLTTRSAASAVWNELLSIMNAPSPDTGKMGGEDWSALSPDEQFGLATRIAANVGYELTPEPEHPDSPHAAPVSGGEGEAVAYLRTNDYGEKSLSFQPSGFDGDVALVRRAEARAPAATERMRAALEPFAKIGGQLMLTPGNRTLTLSGMAVEHDGIPSHGSWSSLKASHFYAARTALAEKEAGR